MMNAEIEIGRGKPFGGRRIFMKKKRLFDRRGEERHDAAEFAFAHMDGGACREMIVQNYCEGGARLNTLGARPLPPVFTLEFPAGKRMRPARVIWRRGPEVGVKFC